MRAVQETIKTQPRDLETPAGGDNSNATSDLAAIANDDEWVNESLIILNRVEHIVEDNQGFMWFGTQANELGMGGPTGAAAKLIVRRTRLISKILRLGIENSALEDRGLCLS